LACYLRGFGKKGRGGTARLPGNCTTRWAKTETWRVLETPPPGREGIGLVLIRKERLPSGSQNLQIQQARIGAGGGGEEKGKRKKKKKNCSNRKRGGSRRKKEGPLWGTRHRPKKNKRGKNKFACRLNPRHYGGKKNWGS